MEVSQPLGSLSGVPRELRDELYAYLVPAKIDLNPLLDGHQYLTSKLSNSLVSTLAILRLSRTIHEEAMTVLYCRGTFRLLLPYHRIRDFRVPSITDRIMNVEFSYRMLVQDIHTIEIARDFDAATYSSLTAPVTLFGGNSIQRKSALIEIWISEWSSYTINTIFSPFFEALKQLTGFRKVTLKLKAPRRPIYDAQRSCQVLESALTRFNSALEPTLGTGVMSELDPSHDPLKDVPLSRQIVFH